MAETDRIKKQGNLAKRTENVRHPSEIRPNYFDKSYKPFLQL